MPQVLGNRTYRHLLRQVLSLIGSGLTTVALGRFAYDPAGADEARCWGSRWR